MKSTPPEQGLLCKSLTAYENTGKRIALGNSIIFIKTKTKTTASDFSSGQTETSGELRVGRSTVCAHFAMHIFERVSVGVFVTVYNVLSFTCLLQWFN